MFSIEYFVIYSISKEVSLATSQLIYSTFDKSFKQKFPNAGELLPC